MKTDNKSSVKVIVEDLSTHPVCFHGKTLLFSLENGEKFFGCSCSRDPEGDCGFKLNYKDFLDGKFQEKFNKKEKTEKTIENSLNLEEVLVVKQQERIYCSTCTIFISPRDKFQHKNHKTIENLTDSQLKEPVLNLLPQLDNDKKEAQYFFNQDSLEFFFSAFIQLKLNKIICVGAPRLHEFLKNKRGTFKSILLDVDLRLRSFNSSKEFCHYNMFNHHFFNGIEDQEKFQEFLTEDSSENVCLFTDPPFAARTEPLIFTFKEISKQYNSINQHHKILPVFWIFPYFMEGYISKFMPEIEMIDYHVNYINHRRYNEDSKDRKQGSPVRVFSNIDQSLFKFPPNQKPYKFCQKCRKFVHKSNNHCNICKICPSKNGATYNHCKFCSICVKPNYRHCLNCGRCTFPSHDCKSFQKHQSCWLCRAKGHVEKNCHLLKQLKLKKLPNCCWICGEIRRHNLRDCPQRKTVLKEEFFLGEILQETVQIPFEKI